MIKKTVQDILMYIHPFSATYPFLGLGSIPAVIERGAGYTRTGQQPVTCLTQPVTLTVR